MHNIRISGHRILRSLHFLFLSNIFRANISFQEFLYTVNRYITKALLSLDRYYFALLTETLVGPSNYCYSVQIGNYYTETWNNVARVKLRMLSRDGKRRNVSPSITYSFRTQCLFQTQQKLNSYFNSHIQTKFILVESVFPEHS